MTRTYIFVFDPDPEGGVVVTCPALPGLVTHGGTLAEARDMALDAMRGYIDTLQEDGDDVPASDFAEVTPRFDRPGRTLHSDGPAPIFEQLSIEAGAAA